jgi:S-adenosylmethionine-dependent methyltransferase
VAEPRRPSPPASGSNGASDPPGLRELVRHVVVGRQLSAHLPSAPASVLDVGSGPRTAALGLARAGHRVVVVEPDERARAAALLARDTEPAAVRSRLGVVEGPPGRLVDALDGERFDAVLAHDGLAGALGAWDAVVELCELVAVGGLVSVVVPNADGAALGPALDHRWADVVDLLSADDPEPLLTDDRGRSVRAQRLEQLASFVSGRRMHVEAWYGVGLLTAAAPAGAAAPEDPDERDTLLMAESLAGGLDPYRRASPLLHLVGRRGSD